MTIFIYILIGFVAGYAARELFAGKKEADAGLITAQKREKEENLQKVMDLFTTREQVANNDIEAALGVSDATATNYLEELEQAGKIRQVGAEGRGVYYEQVYK